MAIATRPKPPAHNKKRLGKHHKTSRHYLKAYWPYLPLIAIVGIGLLFNAYLPKAGGVLGASTDLSAASLLANTNAARSADHETPLVLNAQLAAAAQAKASDMANRDYWSHTTPDNKTPWSFVLLSGYRYQAAGENLAYGFSSAEDVMRGWMNSTEHRANILNNAYRDVGFGIASSLDFQDKGPETIIVAMYGEPLGVTTASAMHPNTSPSAPTGMHTVARLQALDSGTLWSSLALAVLCGAAIGVFVIRHWLAWRKVLIKGELFVLQHVWVDITVITLAMLCFVLSRAAGFIG